VRIVPFKPRHAEGFAVLNRAWLGRYDLWETPGADELSNPHRIAESGGRIYVAERRTSVVGTSAVVCGEPGGMDIRWLAVDPDWQRLGIGRRLLTRCARYARRNGAERLVVHTSSRLTEALRLYRHFGFVDRPMPRDRSSAVADVYMELVLQAAADEQVSVTHA